MKTNATQLSPILTLKDLDEEIEKVKARLYLQKIELEERKKKIAGEAVKAGLSYFLPMFINKKLTGASFTAVGRILKVVLGGKNKAGSVVGAVAKVGLFTALKKGVSNIFGKKQ